MEAKDLRIGNYIKSLGSERQFILEDFSDLFDDSDPIENYNPIPLTEEWLLRFGFKRTKHKGIYQLIGECFDDLIEVRLYYNDKSIEVLDYCEHNGVHLLTELKHVHQLQNLYFALVGEELKIAV